eukprot:m51a1_g851 hypothetical protein (258) ;mRNA; r:787929-788838
MADNHSRVQAVIDGAVIALSLYVASLPPPMGSPAEPTLIRSWLSPLFMAVLVLYPTFGVLATIRLVSASEILLTILAPGHAVIALALSRGYWRSCPEVVCLAAGWFVILPALFQSLRRAAAHMGNGPVQDLVRLQTKYQSLKMVAQLLEGRAEAIAPLSAQQLGILLSGRTNQRLTGTLLPCEHTCLCSRCSVATVRACPVCRKPCTGILAGTGYAERTTQEEYTWQSAEYTREQLKQVGLWKDHKLAVRHMLEPAS